jgi:hypothetical protein
MRAEKTTNCPKCKALGRRVFAMPNVGADRKINPFDLDALTKKTGTWKGAKIGQLWDFAAEMSEKRGGDSDPIRKRALEKYAKDRRNKKYVDKKIKLAKVTPHA